ncbi:hypothetical protein V6Z96_008269 [Aspergillus fumigatus]
MPHIGLHGTVEYTCVRRKAASHCISPHSSNRSRNPYPGSAWLTNSSHRNNPESGPSRYKVSKDPRGKSHRTDVDSLCGAVSRFDRTSVGEGLVTDADQLPSHTNKNMWTGRSHVGDYSQGSATRAVHWAPPLPGDAQHPARQILHSLTIS